MTIIKVASIEYRNVTDRHTDGRTDRIAISISCVNKKVKKCHTPGGV